MSILAIPNVSEGRNEQLVARMAGAISGAGADVLDIHSDAIHNRTVLTVHGEAPHLVEAMSALAHEALVIDLDSQRGVHPRLGGLDVCPFVPHDRDMSEAIAAAEATGRLIGEDVGVPVYLYGRAARRSQTQELPDLRRGGLEGLIARARAGLTPDFGPHEIDPRRGVVCVGARGPLIAFNINLFADLDAARAIAQEVRRPGLLRALGLPLDARRSQVSMNLIDPDRLGIDDAYELVEASARKKEGEIDSTEIVGLIAERHRPQKQAARRLVSPGRSVESAVAGRKTAI